MRPLVIVAVVGLATQLLAPPSSAGVRAASGSCSAPTITGTAGKDTIDGTKGPDVIAGLGGNDTIHAGPWGDVIWGDYKPSGQPTSQADRLYGGAGGDFVYAGHGGNDIRTRGGNDWIKAHFGHGIIDCGGGRDQLFVSRRAQRRYKIRHCETVSHRTVGH